MIASLTLRALVALLEIRAESFKKGTPEQVQAMIAQRDELLDWLQARVLKLKDQIFGED